MKLNSKIINSNIGIFLGAGASAPFGKLLMDSFIDYISEQPFLEKEARKLLSKSINFLC